MLKEAYAELERRMGQLSSPRGEKTQMIKTAIEGLESPFRVGNVQSICPGVSIDLIRYVLKELRDDKVHMREADNATRNIFKNPG